MSGGLDRPALELDDTLAFVMPRTYVVGEDGGTWPCVGEGRWVTIDFRSEDMCRHKITMCELCWQRWYDGHNILLASRKDPTDTRNFDDMAAEARKILGIP